MSPNDTSSNRSRGDMPDGDVYGAAAPVPFAGMGGPLGFLSSASPSQADVASVPHPSGSTEHHASSTHTRSQSLDR